MLLVLCIMAIFIFIALALSSAICMTQVKTSGDNKDALEQHKRVLEFYSRVCVISTVGSVIFAWLAVMMFKGC